MAEQERPLTLKTRLIAGTISTIVKAVCRTCRAKNLGEERVAEVIAEHSGAILVSWHGRTFYPLSRMCHRGYIALVSFSKDGDIQAQNFRNFGFEIVRGSTGRGGDRAAVQILRKLKTGGVLAFTPDGPRGPSRSIQPGVVFFAQRSGKPIIPVGVAAKPCWHVPTWDSFLVPSPFARVVCLWGEPIFLDKDEDPDLAASRVKTAIDTVEAEAEALLNAKKS